MERKLERRGIHADYLLQLVRSVEATEKGSGVVLSSVSSFRDFPGGPMAKTPRSQCRGLGFDPWSGNYDPTRCN